MSGTDAPPPPPPPPPPPQPPDTMPSGSMAEEDTETLFEGTPAEPQTAPPAEIIAEEMLCK